MRFRVTGRSSAVSSDFYLHENEKVGSMEEPWVYYFGASPEDHGKATLYTVEHVQL